MNQGGIARRTLLNGAALAALSVTVSARESRGQQMTVPNSSLLHISVRMMHIGATDLVLPLRQAL